MGFRERQDSIMTNFVGVSLVVTLTINVTLAFQQPVSPVFPKAFSVQFAEVKRYTYTHSGKLISANNGSWHYDYSNLRARFDHNRGQLNSFCQNQNLSQHDPSAPCHLLFTPPGDMFVHYPENKNCCRLCGEKEGCTILRPDWLRNAHVIESEFVNGLACYDWATPGAVADADILLVSDNGVFCRYSESFKSVSHNLTFTPGTFKVGPQDPVLFQVPAYCHRTCPRPFPTNGIHESIPMFGGRIQH